MLIYLDERLIEHPKILRAAAQLGPNGRALAIALYLDGLAYARNHLTDGIVPTVYLTRAAIVPKPLTVAAALVRAKLWIKCPSGFRIHHFHHWNKSAEEIKKIRRQWAAKKRRQRHGNNGHFSLLSRPVSLGDNTGDKTASKCPPECLTETRARVRDHSIHTYVLRLVATSLDRKIRKACTDLVLTAHCVRGILAQGKNDASPDPLATALCDQTRHDRTLADNDRRRMGRGDQTPARRVESRIPEAVRDHGRHARRRACVVETVGVTRNTGGVLTVGAASPGACAPTVDDAVDARRGVLGVAGIARSGHVAAGGRQTHTGGAAVDAARDRATQCVATNDRADSRSGGRVRSPRIERAA